MVQYQFDNDAYSAAVCLLQKLFEVVERAVVGMNRTMIRNIETIIL